MRTAPSNRTVCSRRCNLAWHAAAATLGAVLLLSSSGCSDLNWPFHRAGASDASTSTDSEDSAAECADIQAQIRANEESLREAPATSVNPDIVDAAQARAQKHIDDLRERYASLDCPGDASPRPARVPPLQPAPGAINR